MTAPIFTGTIKKGWPNFPDDIIDIMGPYFAAMEGKTITMCVKLLDKKRSLNQNAYYWGVVIKLIADHSGYRGRKEILEVADEMRKKFLKVVLFGEAFVLSSTALNTVQFEEYQSKIRQWASIALDLYIPEPNECEIPDTYETGE